MVKIKKGKIKVMHGAAGKPKIQEELGDTVKVYSYDGWVEELKKRTKEALKAEENLVDSDEAQTEATKLLELPNQDEVEEKGNNSNDNG